MNEKLITFIPLQSVIMLKLYLKMILQILIIQNIQTYFLKNIVFIFKLLANKRFWPVETIGCLLYCKFFSRFKIDSSLVKMTNL